MNLLEIIVPVLMIVTLVWVLADGQKGDTTEFREKKDEDTLPMGSTEVRRENL